MVLVQLILPVDLSASGQIGPEIRMGDYLIDAVPLLLVDHQQAGDQVDQQLVPLLQPRVRDVVTPGQDLLVQFLVVFGIKGTFLEGENEHDNSQRPQIRFEAAGHFGLEGFGGDVVGGSLGVRGVAVQGRNAEVDDLDVVVPVH